MFSAKVSPDDLCVIESSCGPVCHEASVVAVYTLDPDVALAVRVVQRTGTVNP